MIASQGAAYLGRLASALADSGSGLLKPFRELASLPLGQIDSLTVKFNDLRGRSESMRVKTRKPGA